MSGYDARDPYAMTETVDWLGALKGSVRGWRIAYSPDYGAFPVDGRVRALVGEAARAFEEAGAHVEEVEIDIHRSAFELGELWNELMVASSVVTTDRLKRRGIDLLKDHRSDLPPELAYWIEKVQAQNIVDLADAQEVRTEVFDAIQAVFEGHDLLLGPTLLCPPVDNAKDGNTRGPESLNGEPLSPLIGFCPTFLFNFTGHPAASIPAGLVDGKWPVGMQITGRKYADTEVMTASAVFEQLRPWQQHYGICRAREL